MEGTKAVLAFSNEMEMENAMCRKGESFAFIPLICARFQFDLFLSRRAKHSAEITLSLLAYL